MVFATEKYIGLHVLPIDGNPYKYVGFLGHASGVFQKICQNNTFISIIFFRWAILRSLTMTITYSRTVKMIVVCLNGKLKKNLWTLWNNWVAKNWRHFIV